jgi:DNA modification methylase
MKTGEFEKKIAALKKIYNTPLSSNRNGALYNAFSYATKISPESIAIFIACHTEIGATVLDPFGGSGTTGLAAKLCDVPTQTMIDRAEELGLNPKWGKRNAILYELSTLGSFIGSVMCNPPSPLKFEKAAKALVAEVEKEMGNLYAVIDADGNAGLIRYVIWSDVLVCPNCGMESSFWDVSVKEKPLSISSQFTCRYCHHSDVAAKVARATEHVHDDILNEDHIVKKRVPVKIYGRTGKKTWSRPVTQDDINRLNTVLTEFSLTDFPHYKIAWGGLYRSGYHNGISHLHHFYTKRNAIVISRLWSKIGNYPAEIQNALKFLVLSYNSSHSTLMTRVVVKKNSKDFVITGSQSGILYISNLPIEKNILEGVSRKIATIKQAFQLVEKSQSNVAIFNSSSTFLHLSDKSIDYVFTDPPFGDYIPYSEVNQINEAWLGRITDKLDEVIVDSSQGKGIPEYRELMHAVFAELSRVLKDNGLMSLVFHSAQSEIWQALVESYQRADLRVIISSILDKIQSSFKQTNSVVKVQGDPLLLLAKSSVLTSAQVAPEKNLDAALIEKLITYAFTTSDSPDEQKLERLFSRYINACLEAGRPISYNASEFYELIKQELPKNQYSS